MEVDTKYPDKIEEKTKISRFCPEIKRYDSDNFTPFLNEIKLNDHTSNDKLLCGWDDKKDYSIHYRILKNCVIHGKIGDKVHEIISFKQIKGSKNV